MKKFTSKLFAMAVAGTLALTAAVTFRTVTASAASETDASDTDASDVDLDGEYGAYVFIQGPAFTFRDKYDNSGTGYGTVCFDQVNKQGDTTGTSPVPATINDVVIKGNGTYTASITGIEWPGDEFNSDDQLNLIGLSTSIPMTDEVVISDIVLKIDGKEIEQKAEIVTPESDDPGDYLEVIIRNKWAEDNPDVFQIGFYPVPFEDIFITFTVSGFNYDNPDATGDVVEDTEEADTTEWVSGDDTTTEAAPVTEASATDKDKDDDSKSFPVIPVVICVVAVVGVWAVALKKKK